MEARRTFGGASGSKQLGIVLVAVIAAALLAVAGVMLASGLSVGSAPAAPAVKTYFYSPKNYPQHHAARSVTTSKPDLSRFIHTRPGSI